MRDTSRPTSESGETVLAAGGDAALVVETLATMDAQTAEGAALLSERAVSTEDAGPLTLLGEWTAAQSDGLAELRDDVPAAATDEVADSLALLTDIATRVSGLDASLDCAAGPAVAGTDALGPVPAPCPPGGSVTTVPEAPGGATGSTPEAPPSGTTVTPPLPEPSLPSEVAPGVPGVPGSTGTGGVPTPAVPPLPTRGLPSPAPPSAPLPVPPVPQPLPSATPTVPRLPGTTGLPVPSATPPGPVDLCLGPIAVGDC